MTGAPKNKNGVRDLDYTHYRLVCHPQVNI